MKLRAITLTDIRRFTDPLRIDGIESGLNVLSAPNEHGKSTVFDAIQALFFKPHGSKDKDIRSLQPHAGGAPEVEIEVETQDGIFTVAKRWISKPHARVSSEGRLIAQADAAEDWINRALGQSEGGPSGLLWVRQGMTGLTGGGTQQDKAALEARRDLMSSVGHEVEAMTGGRRMDQALARCRSELGVYVTGTGRPRTGGPLKEAQNAVTELEDAHAALKSTADALHEALDHRRRLRRELAEIEDPDAVADRRARLAAANEAHAAATRHAEEIEAETRKVDAARAAVARADERLTTLRETLAERTEAARLLAGAEAESALRGEQRDAATVAAKTASDALADADAQLQQATRTCRLAERREAAEGGAARRAELIERLTAAEAARARIEAARTAAAQGPDAKTLAQLQTLAATRDAAIAARDATATRIVMHYVSDPAGAVTLNGRPLAEGQAVAIPQTARLAIDGIGTLELHPATAEQDEAGVITAQNALDNALNAAGVETMSAAHAAAETRAAAQRELDTATATFDSLAPQGLEALRAKLAAIPEAEDLPDGPSLADAEATLDAAGTTRLAALAARDAAMERLSDARIQSARAETAATAARERLARAKAQLARLEGTDEDALAETLTRATDSLKAAEAVLAERRRTAPDLVATEAALNRARSVDATARETLERLKPELARLDERISRDAGDAVEERLAETEDALATARDRLARVEHEVAVLRRLELALDAAKTQARDRYFAPIAAELRPLLRLLWPDAQLSWEPESLLPSALIREGTEEPIEILSGGTQEQVALMVRLAFARMLAGSGRHAPVILDDALVFTDDERIERMFDALHRQSGDLQIIVLSCRQRAFRELGGRTLHMSRPQPTGG